MTLAQAYDEFILQKQLAGLSPATVEDYSTFLGVFLRSVDDSVDVMELSFDTVRNFILDLYKRPLSRATVATYIRNIRIFLCWVASEYDMSFDPAKIKVPKSPKKLVHIYSDKEIQYLFSCVKTSVPWITARNRAILALMLDSGLRQAEVCNLMKSKIDRERMVMHVTGKGSKDRLVPLGYVSLALLDDYLSLCPFKASDRVFVGRYNKPITGNAVRVFVNRLKHQLPFELTSHKLRHNFATNYCLDNLRETGNSHVYDLSILMGHESIETTKSYEHFAHEIIATENRRSHLDGIYRM